MLSYLTRSRLSFIVCHNRTRGRTIAAWLLGILLSLSGPFLPGQDWPQLLGVHRDGSSPEHAPLATQWPPELEVAWQAGLGSGLGGPAIVGDRVFILHRQEDQELLEATDMASGRSLWRRDWPASYRASYNPDDGPRCVPTIAQGKAVCYGAAGDLSCVDIHSGELLWHRRLRAEYAAADGYFGAGSAPLVVKDLIVVCLGGKQAGIIGLDLHSGKTRWTATRYDASYAAPIAIDEHTALVVTRLRTVLLDLRDGTVLSEVSFGSRGPTVNAATPIAVGEGQFLMTASYGVGSTLLHVQPPKLNELFRGSELLSSQYNTPVLVDRQVLGIHGREDVGVASLRALDLEQRQIVWEQAGFGTAHLIRVGSHQVLVLSLDGTLTLLDGRAQKFQPLAHSRLPRGTYRALPALSAGRLLVRQSDDQAGSSQLLCVPLPLQASP